MVVPEAETYIADIETDGLNPTKIWCMSYCSVETGEIKTVVDCEDIRKLVSNPNVNFVFHNGYCYDKPVIERLVGCKFKAGLIDTLPISWYLYPTRQSHGLELWGVDLGIPKPEITDWENLTLEEYIHRCEEDVKINTLLYNKCITDLQDLYSSKGDYWDAIDYVCFKMECIALQEKCKWRLDVSAAETLVMEFEAKIEEAKTTLESVMPQVPKVAKRTKPKKPFKKCGGLSATGERWKELTEANKLPFEYDGVINEVVGYNPPNAGSTTQIKDWLFSLGWVPLHFKHVRNKETGEVSKIPQVKNPDTGELCDNVLEIAEDFPELNSFVELGILTHRKSVVEGFLKDVDEDGFIQASAQGFTNTLRLRHRTFLNVPSARKPYGKEIRSLLIARDGYELMGSDMQSLEDRTKQHYMWPHDPEYVKEMQKPGFDPHCDIAAEAEIMTKAEVFAYKYMDKNELSEVVSPQGNYYSKKELSKKRHAGKGTNYASTYGAGAETIARTANVPIKVGRKLHKAYWDRNWSLKAIASSCIVKHSRGVMWLWNPVAKLWYYLKKDKDRFSTLNQGTGTYCFDMWIREVLKSRYQLTGQAHDEGIWEVKLGNRDKGEKLLKDAVEAVNKKLKLNRELGVDVQFGNTYADIH